MTGKRVGDVVSVQWCIMSGERVLGVRDTEEEARHLCETLAGSHVKRITWVVDVVPRYD